MLSWELGAKLQGFAPPTDCLLVRHGPIAAQLGNCHVDPYFCPETCLFLLILVTFLWQIAVEMARMCSKYHECVSPVFHHTGGRPVPPWRVTTAHRLWRRFFVPLMTTTYRLWICRAFLSTCWTIVATRLVDPIPLVWFFFLQIPGWLWTFLSLKSAGLSHTKWLYQSVLEHIPVSIALSD
jgi:hypothetical protein